MRRATAPAHTTYTMRAEKMNNDFASSTEWVPNQGITPTLSFFLLIGLTCCLALQYWYVQRHGGLKKVKTSPTRRGSTSGFPEEGTIAQEGASSHAVSVEIVIQEDSYSANTVGKEAGAGTVRGRETDGAAKVSIVEETTAPPKFFYLSVSALHREYLLVFLTCFFADWLKGPYTVALYQQYGFSIPDMAFLFISGFAASLLGGTVVGALSDRYGRARTCRLFCVFQAISMVTKLSPDLYVLSFGRAAGGVATSLLCTSFEAWLVSEHHRHAFASEDLQDTFVQCAFYNSLMAVVAGVAAQIAASLFGNVAPFLLAVPFLCWAFVRMWQWPENYGDHSIPAWHTILNGITEIRESSSLQLLCLCEALFEACMCIWVFMWTPLIDKTNRQSAFGVLFASFMMCTMMGGLCGRIWESRVLLPAVHVIATASLGLSVVWIHHKVLLFFCFCAYEVSVGTYFSMHPGLRAQLISNTSRSAVLNLFRIPMNLSVFCILKLNFTPEQLLALMVPIEFVSGVCLFCLLRRL